LVYVATIGPKGEPQNSPVWFGWDGSHILFSLTKGHQKYRNLQREPRIALSFAGLSDPLAYLEVRGEVVRIDEDIDNRFINSMAKKYLNQDVFPWHKPGDERVVIVVDPKRISKLK
jgi:PPOX class probable F420-dependent enzyme